MRGRAAPARGAQEEAALEQVGLVDVLDRVRLLVDGHRERREPDRAAAELAADRAEDLAVQAVQALLVDLQQVQRGAGRLGVDDAAAADLRVVAHALEQAVGHARGAAGALGDRPRAGGLDLDLQHARAAGHDPRQVVGRVVVEPVLDAEAVAQRRRQQAGARGGADERERRQVERDDARARPGADRDRQLAVLHRGIEGLLDRARQPVDLVDEEHRARLERGQERRDVGLALERRAGGLHERHVELGGDDLRQRGLAEPGRAGQQHVVERLAALGGRLDRDAELLAQRLLADELLQPARAQRGLGVVVGAHAGGLHARRGPGRPAAVGRVDGEHAGRADRLRAHRRASRSAAAIRSSGVSPVASRSSPSASAGV